MRTNLPSRLLCVGLLCGPAFSQTATKPRGSWADRPNACGTFNPPPVKPEDFHNLANRFKTQGDLEVLDPDQNSYKISLCLFKVAAAKGVFASATNVGNAYFMGRGVPVDYKEAMRWYQIGAAIGNWASMENIGHLYENGQGVAKNPKEAARWMALSEQARVARGGIKQGALDTAGVAAVIVGMIMVDDDLHPQTKSEHEQEFERWNARRRACRAAGGTSAVDPCMH